MARDTPQEYYENEYKRLPFERRLEEINYWIDKRRSRWELASVEWADVSQKILIRIHQNYPKFDPKKGKFGHWVNVIISSTIKNVLRDEYTTFSRPCILGCTENTGGNTCRRTPSGIQCKECPLYKEWEEKKGDQYAIRQTLPLDHHFLEADSKQSDFMDIEAGAETIHAKMKDKLTHSEWRVYRVMVIKGLSIEEVSKHLGFRRKRGASRAVCAGYSQLLVLRRKFIAKAQEIIAEEGLA